MTKRGPDKPKIDPAPKSSEPFNNPFAKLAGAVPTSNATAPEPAAPAKPAAPQKPTATPAKPAKPGPKPPARAVVRYERKGRGGKEVTLVEKLGLPPAVLAEWCKDLKRSLGVGGQVEGDALVLQGDQRERLRTLLEGRGVGQISVS